MDKLITVAIIGCGGRGSTYGRLMHERFEGKFKIVALCDISIDNLTQRGDEYGVAPENRFLDETEFFEMKRADLLVIGTQDRDHFRMAIKGMELGCDVLVEKPLTTLREECEALLACQEKTGAKVFVGHVLRYAPAFLKAEEILNSGELGRLVSIEDTEQIWYGHFAHSFVRGSWRRKDETSPMILAKSCHDLDMIQHLAGAQCVSISSVGDLNWFKEENAPEGAAMRCTECKYMETCPYSAKRLYVDRLMRKPNYSFASIICRPKPCTIENTWEAIRESRYGRCVYHCDNDVCDHQLSVMTFANGVKAVLNTNAFTGNGGRIMKMGCTLGELILDETEDTITIKRYGIEEHEVIKIADLNETTKEGHGGGDPGLVTTLYEMLMGHHDAVTSLKESVESHLIGIAAEESRLKGGELVYVHKQ